MSKRESIVLRVMVRIWAQSERAFCEWRDDDANALARLFGRLQALHQIRTDDNLLDLVG